MGQRVSVATILLCLELHRYMTDGCGSGPQNLFGPWSSLPAPNLDSKWHSITIDNTNQDSCHQENVIYSAYLKIAEK